MPTTILKPSARSSQSHKNSVCKVVAPRRHLTSLPANPGVPPGILRIILLLPLVVLLTFHFGLSTTVPPVPDLLPYYRDNSPAQSGKAPGGRTHAAQYSVDPPGGTFSITPQKRVPGGRLELAMEHPRLCLLFITLEYKSGTFSGNGIYAMSMVRSLASLGHSLFVISATPPSGSDDPASPPAPTLSRMDVETNLVEIPISVWGRLDWKCGFEDFGNGIDDATCQAVKRFSPHWVLAVDWSAIGVYKNLSQRARWQQEERREGMPAPPLFAYLNYRVYTLSEYSGGDGEKEREFYREREGEAMALADVAAGLSRSEDREAHVEEGRGKCVRCRDAEFLGSSQGLGFRMREGVKAKSLLPPLREDIRQLALVQQAQLSASSAGARWQSGRRYLTCCVRLSPEKNAALFADIIEATAPFLRDQGIIPLICAGAGGRGAPGYPGEVIRRVVAAEPDSEVIEGFMGPERMGEVYSKTLLNIHPCLYDAYGMTLVEAAAFAAPSLVNVGTGGAVGATELLDPSQGLVVAMDLAQSIDAIAEKLMEVLRNKELLQSIAMKAAHKSVSYSEEANAIALTEILGEARGRIESPEARRSHS